MFLEIFEETNDDFASSNCMDVGYNSPCTTFFCMFTPRQPLKLIYISYSIFDLTWNPNTFKWLFCP